MTATATAVRHDPPCSAEADPRWQRIMDRDPSGNGSFWYSVATTGIYCQPSCPSRRPNPRNIRFHDSPADAERSGFRACLRCRPNDVSRDEQQAAIVVRACRAIELSTAPISLNQLAEAAKLSPGYFHRLFKTKIGLTPKGYACACRAKTVRRQLNEGQSVTDAIYGSGFNSNSRFYEKSTKMLGMQPQVFRTGGADVELRFAVGQCALGAILVASSDKGVCAILLGEDPDLLARDLQDRFPHAHLLGGDKGYEMLVAQVVGFVEAPEVGLELPLDVRGTVFQQRVWTALGEIPLGRTATYGEIAQRIGQPGSTRAVAGACAANALAVAIPCHRVIRHDGTLSGYRWGVERKRELIKREAQAVAR